MSVLGLKSGYTVKDLIVLETKLNYEKRLKGGRKEEATLSPREVAALRDGSQPWGRRQALNLWISTHVPMQPRGPFLHEGMLLLRCIATPTLPWDAELPPGKKKKWAYRMTEPRQTVKPAYNA